MKAALLGRNLARVPHSFLPSRSSSSAPPSPSSSFIHNNETEGSADRATIVSYFLLCSDVSQSVSQSDDRINSETPRSLALPPL